jgi:MazG family protein
MTAHPELDRLVDTMATLREQCPWDRQQTHRSLVAYLVEETCEVVEAVEGLPDGRVANAGPAAAHLQEELGDLLLQVVFHAQLASESPDGFDISDVAAGIADKLIARHPHVFADARIGDTKDLNRAWEEHKARERAGKGQGEGEGKAPSELADVPLALPSLARAAKLGKRAGRVGFDWPDATGVRAKVDEELREIDALSPEGAPRRGARRPVVRRRELGTPPGR